MLGSTGPLEAKVTAATGGSIIGTALAGAVIWALDTYLFRTTEVPDPVVVLVWAVIPAGLTLLAGWRARHTPRVDSDALSGVHDAEVERLADRDARRSDPLLAERLETQQRANLEKLADEFGGSARQLPDGPGQHRNRGGYTGSTPAEDVPPPQKFPWPEPGEHRKP